MPSLGKKSSWTLVKATSKWLTTGNPAHLQVFHSLARVSTVQAALGRYAVRDHASRWRAEKVCTVMTFWSGGIASHQTRWLQGAGPIAGACRSAENDGSTVLDSVRRSLAELKVSWAMSMYAVFRVPPEDGPKTARPVTRSIPKSLEASGSAGMEDGCTRIPARRGGAVPSLPGRIGLMDGGRRGACVGATGTDAIPFGCGINGVSWYARRFGADSRSATGLP
jgi:hypothetical protein